MTMETFFPQIFSGKVLIRSDFAFTYMKKHFPKIFNACFRTCRYSNELFCIVAPGP